MLKEGIAIISLESNGNLLVQYKNGTSQSVSANNPNLQQVKNYLQKNSKQSISLEELETSSDPNSKNPKRTDYLPWIIGGGVILVLVIIVIWLLVRDREKR